MSVWQSPLSRVGFDEYTCLLEHRLADFKEIGQQFWGIAVDIVNAESSSSGRPSVSLLDPS